MAVIDGIGSVAGDGPTGELIGRRVHDGAEQAAQVVAVGNQIRARASSSSGLVGGLVSRRSSTGSTRPRPRKCAQ